MKYSPEELLAYAEEEGYLYHIFHATRNNDFGYQHMPVKGKFHIDENGKLTLHISSIGEDNHAEDFSMPVDYSEDEKDWANMLVSDKYIKRLTAVLYKDKNNLLVSIGKNEKEVEEDMTRKIMLDFLTNTEIDTRGKLKNVIRRGEEIFSRYCDTQDYLESIQNEQGILTADLSDIM